MLTLIARGDSLPTLSKSCSDKLALKQCTSLLTSATIPLISPANAYFETIILPQPQYNEASLSRAFGADGRMKPVAGRSWHEGFSHRPFRVCTTMVDFDFSRRRSASEKAQLSGSNISAVWTPGVRETLINGVLQGRKQGDPRGASALSRKRMRELASLVLDQLDQDASSAEARFGPLAFNERKVVKQEVTSVALKGWLPNHHDGFEKSC